MGFWTRPLSFLEQCRARYGKRFTLRIPMAPPFVMISDPAEVKQVFTAPADVLHPGEGAKVLEPIVGNHSVLLLDGGAHMEQRKLMLPAFHGEKMDRLSDVMSEVAEREVAAWPRDTPIELHPRMQRLTLEVILRAVFGLVSGPRLDALRERMAALLAFGESAISLMPPPPDSLAARILERVGPFAGFVRLRSTIDEMLFELIDERRREEDEGDDVLAMLLAARHEDGSPMTREEVRDELLTLLVAGHETTASSLAWLFESLPHHPEILQRLTDDIASGDGDAYLTATIQESMRCRPVLPNAAPRLVMQPVDVGGWTYPAGVCLVPNAYLIHHDPDIYPDPYAFRPERFIDEEAPVLAGTTTRLRSSPKPPGTYTWIPFGGGRRRCLGASFAMLETKLVVRTLLEACELKAGGERFERARRRNITVRPGGGALTVLGQRKPAPVAVAGAS